MPDPDLNEHFLGVIDRVKAARAAREAAEQQCRTADSALGRAMQEHKAAEGELRRRIEALLA